MSEVEMLMEKAHSIIDQMPTFQQCLGCMDCNNLFRYGNACPFCKSESIINVADVLSRGDT